MKGMAGKFSTLGDQTICPPKAFFQNQGGFSRPQAVNGGGEPRRTSANDNDIIHLALFLSFLFAIVYEKRAAASDRGGPPHIYLYLYCVLY